MLRYPGSYQRKFASLWTPAPKFKQQCDAILWINLEDRLGTSLGPEIVLVLLLDYAVLCCIGLRSTSQRNLQVVAGDPYTDLGAEQLGAIVNGSFGRL